MLIETCGRRVRSGCLAQRASDGKGGSERDVAADRVRSNCGLRAAELVMCCDNIKTVLWKN